jgi:phosphoserine aminotransferase
VSPWRSDPLTESHVIPYCNDQKVYEILDNYPDVFLAPVSKANRSRMNVVFRIQGGEEKEKEFIDKAGEKGIKQIKGHRSVGGESGRTPTSSDSFGNVRVLTDGTRAFGASKGIRTSLYNAVTLDQVDVLCTFMVGFAKAYS